jgi:hypothetical protein
MSNQATIIPEKIHLNEIRLIKDELIIGDILGPKPTFDIVVAHSMVHNLERQAVKIRLFIDVLGQIDNHEINKGGNYELDFTFIIEDMKNHYEVVENAAVFSGLFVATLLGISYSTARGILFHKWAGTILDGIILPVISVPRLLESKR